MISALLASANLDVLDDLSGFPPIGFLEWWTTVDRDRSDIIGRIGAAVGGSGEQQQRVSFTNEK